MKLGIGQPTVRLLVVAHIFAATSAQSTDFAKWLPPQATYEDLQVLCRGQVIVEYRDPRGRFISTGMGTPVSGSELRTAAHVVSGARLGDDVRVAPCTELRSQVDWSQGKIVQIDREMDLATIRLDEGRFPPDRIPAICQSRPLPGASLISLRAEVRGAVIASYAADQAVVTSLTVLPPLRPEVDEHVGAGNYSLVAQVGLPRIVAAGSSVSGASGGAMWDVQRRCAAGVTSAGIEFEFLATREQTLREAGDPPYASFLVGAPVLKP